MLHSLEAGLVVANCTNPSSSLKLSELEMKRSSPSYWIDCKDVTSKMLTPSSIPHMENSERMRQCYWTERFGAREGERERKVETPNSVFLSFNRPCTSFAHIIPHLTGPQICLSSSTTRFRNWHHSTQLFTPAT